MDPPSAAEQRAFAVAKLKRAASLPRMQNGRRPKMHVEAVSEGEKSPGQGSQAGGDTPDARTPDITRTPEPEEIHVRPSSVRAQNAPVPQEPYVSATTEPPRLAEASPEPRGASETPRTEDMDPDDTAVPDAPVPEPPEREQTTTPGPEETTQQKKRRRSRSRSRGSKDLRKLRGAPSPAPTPTPLNGDSSPEELPAPLPAFTPFAPPLVAPTPSRFAQLGAQRLVMTPEPNFFYGSPISPGSPMLPSLEALRTGLYRSNSAAGRMMAMQKLTSGTELLGDIPSPTRTPPAGMLLGRNNTVSGGERSAVRKVLLRRLGERMERADAATEPPRAETSAGSAAEDSPQRPLTPRRRKRRSRRGSVSGQGVVDDRDLSSTAPDTSVPPTPQLPSFNNLPDSPRAPSTAPDRRLSTERERLTTLAKLMGGASAPLPTVGASSDSASTPRTRRSVVIEDNYDGPDNTTSTSYPSSSMHHRLLNTPNATSARSIDGAIGVPVFLSDMTTYNHDALPTSVHGSSPPQDKTLRDDDDEPVLFSPDSSRLQPPWQRNDRDLSWVEPPLRMPVNDDDDDDDDDDEDEGQDAEARFAEEDDNDDNAPLSAAPSEEFPPKPTEAYDAHTSASESRELLTEREHSLEISSYVPSSSRPSGEENLESSQTGSTMRLSETFSSPLSPARRSLAETEQEQFSPISRSEVLPTAGWENMRPVAPPMEATTSRSKWEKVKQSFSRSNSRNGRRSRTNSVTARVEYTDSTASRESGASQVSTRGDGGVPVPPLVTPPLLSPAASSASVLSLGPAPHRGGVSPIPPPTPADLSRYQNVYQNVKLFPFPGMVRLEEERARAKGALAAASASSPDIISPIHTESTSSLPPSSWSAATTKAPENTERERKLSQHASDTHLRGLFQASLPPPIPLSATNSQASQHDHVNGPSSQPDTLAHSGSTQNLKQPTGMKRWLSSKKLFSSQSNQPAAAPALTSPTYQHTSVETAKIRDELPEAAKSRQPRKMPSFSDLLKVGGRKGEELNGSWEQITNESTPTTTTSGSTVAAPGHGTTVTQSVSVSHDATPSRDSSQSPEQLNGMYGGWQTPSYASAGPSAYPSPPEPPYSSATPDPLSSLDDYPPTSSASSSTMSSRYSNQQPPHQEPETPSQGTVVVQRLEEMLGRGSRSPMWASVVDDPPRKLVLSSPVLQVVNCNTVKDRFLFLFNDILVIAKPIMSELDVLLETKPSPQDRKFAVKSVVRLHELRFSAERDTPQTNASTYGSPPRSAAMDVFVQQFVVNPDQAISTLFAKAHSRDNPQALGQLVFRTNDIEKVALGEYLARRASRLVLKAYLDGFGFAGMRIDTSLRAFLLSIAAPPRTLEYLMDSFASRWYDANADVLPYGKDLAVSLCRSILQLNDAMHGGIAREPGATPYPRRNVTSRDFVAAFRRYYPSTVVSDDLLDQIYQSVRHERLATSRHSSLDLLITMKRPLPPRVTYRMQSEPVVLRIPAPDPHLSIMLHGEGLTFDPPVLTFARSSEVSFRITGTALGTKSVLLVRAGPNAAAYGGLPRAHVLQVERAFMRNTFQIAFENHEGEKRKYMFSVDDPLVRHQWTVSLRAKIEQATVLARTDPSTPDTSRFHRAAESVAVKILQQTLIGAPSTPAERHGHGESTVRAPTHRFEGGQNGHQRGLQIPARMETRRSRQGGSLHVRSKSRSQVYHRHGPGKFELDLNVPELPGRESRNGVNESGDEDLGEDRTPHHKLWSGGELELVCQQNSSISLVLSFLQVGSPDHQDLRGVSASSL